MIDMSFLIALGFGSSNNMKMRFERDKGRNPFLWAVAYH